MPSNGAIYSEVNVIVSGTVKGRVTVATPNEIIIGGNILYDGDGSFTTPVLGKNVLGLEAVKDVVVPCWIMGDLDWRAAVVAQGVGRPTGPGRLRQLEPDRDTAAPSPAPRR